MNAGTRRYTPVRSTLYRIIAFIKLLSRLSPDKSTPDKRLLARFWLGAPPHPRPSFRFSIPAAAGDRLGLLVRVTRRATRRSMGSTHFGCFTDACFVIVFIQLFAPVAPGRMGEENFRGKIPAAKERTEKICSVRLIRQRVIGLL